MRKIAGVCVVVIAFGSVSACIATKQSYVSKGNKLYDAGKYADASLNYRKAIQKDPNFGEAYYRLGLSAIKQDQTKEAYNSLYRAVQLAPGNVDAKEKFADVCLAVYLAGSSRPQFLYSQLAQLSDELLSNNGNSYEGLMVKGYLASTDRKPKEAIAFFRKALQIRSDPGVTTELVRMLIQDGQTLEGEKLAMELLARQKAYSHIYDVLYDFYASSGRIADAENILKVKVKNNPQNADYILQLAQYYVRSQKPTELRATLEQLVGNSKEFPQALLWIGDFYVGLKNYPEALRYYQEGAAQQRKDKLVYDKRVVVTLLAEGKRDEAFRLTARILKENPKDNETLHLHADLLVDSEKPENADAALQEFQALVKEYPGDAALRAQLGRAYRLKGDLQAARRQFLEALNQRKDLVAARYELAEIGLIQVRPEEAVRQANEVLKQFPKDDRGRLLLARGLMVSGDLATARTELTALTKDSPRYTEAQVQLGLLMMMQSKYSEAIDVFDKLRDSGDPRAFAGLGMAYSFQRQGDKAQEVLREGLKKWPNSTLLLEELAGTQALAGHYDLAIAQFREVLAKDPKSISARRHLGEIYESRGDHANAVILYQQAFDLAPNDVNVAMVLADGLARAGRAADAKKQFEAILNTNPDNTAALNNLAFLLADTGGDLDQALRLVQRALSKMPNQPAFSDTVGYIYLKKGLNDTAVQTFGQLVNKYPHLAAFRYHLGLALFEKGDKTAARRELQTALNEHPSLPDKLKIRELLDKIG